MEQVSVVHHVAAAWSTVVIGAASFAVLVLIVAVLVQLGRGRRNHRQDGV